MIDRISSANLGVFLIPATCSSPASTPNILNTLYVDKNLKHHGLIQAFSRTNRVLNATKPYGHILDFRQQQDSVDAAIALFSGAQPDRAREIWLVDKAPVVIDNFKQAIADLGEFMQSQGLEAKPDQVNNLMGDDARAQFIKRFKEVQRLQTQLDQYTDLTDEQREQIEQTLPKDDLRAFRGVYLETAQRLKEQQVTPGKDGDLAKPEVDQLDFEFVLFASAVIDYDYIMKLIAKYSGQDPKKLTISREQLIGLIQSDAKFLDEREEITEYVRSLKEGEGLDEAAIRAGYERFKAEKQAREIEGLARAHGLTTESLAAFVDTILQRMIFDGEQLTDLMEPLDLGWRERRERELALMADLVPLLNKRAHGRDISGLVAYEHGAHDDDRQADLRGARVAVSRVPQRRRLALQAAQRHRGAHLRQGWDDEVRPDDRHDRRRPLEPGGEVRPHHRWQLVQELHPETNDFAYNKSATKEFPQGYIARYSGTKDAAVPNSIFTCFRPNTAVVIPEYLDHLFHGNHHGRWLRKYITVGARAHGALNVSGDDLMSMPVPRIEIAPRLCFTSHLERCGK